MNEICLADESDEDAGTGGRKERKPPKRPPQPNTCEMTGIEYRFVTVIRIIYIIETVIRLFIEHSR